MGGLLYVTRRICVGTIAYMNHRRPLVYDLDGTLVDTRHLVCQAYAAAGVSVMPQELQQHWREWLLPKVSYNESEAALIRTVKTNFYQKWIADGASLPLTKTGRDVKKLVKKENIRVITAGHPSSARAVLRAVGLEECIFIGTEVAGKDRPELLRALGRVGTYFDDCRETIDHVKEDTDWDTVLV